MSPVVVSFIRVQCMGWILYIILQTITEYFFEKVLIKSPFVFNDNTNEVKTTAMLSITIDTI
jgi:hypothetical protein